MARPFQLTRLFHSWSAAADEGNYVGAVFFDIRKAFDTVWHDALVMKLRAAGLHGRALKWLTSFLSDRTQSTLVEGYVSQPAPHLCTVVFPKAQSLAHSCSQFMSMTCHRTGLPICSPIHHHMLYRCHLLCSAVDYKNVLTT